MATQTQHRLPDTVVPEHYEIEITPDLAGSSFTGKETIKVQVRKPVEQVVLNCAAIEISRAVARLDDGSRFEGLVTCNEEAQTATIAFKGDLAVGIWYLDLEFAGILDPKLRGFYRSTYKDAAGKEHLLATTKFEPSDARRAFPCFDEPALKATFKVALLIDKDQTALSNMDVESQEPAAGGKKLVRFGPSIRMSSYLVFWCVGPFEPSEPVMAGNVELRVWSVPGKKHLHAFPLEAGKFALEWLSDYFGVAYPSKKLDLIAIPDFASGAMENYGAVTFRETALLIDPARASQADMERVAEVVAHEIAHMWFGDLVTMFWWNGLWLNEAFATFLATKITDQFRPSWKFWETFNTQKAAAMRVDGLTTTRTIEFPVETPEDARAMFDILTYEKGCSILRMLELYIGEETMRDGMRRYVKRHLYANTETVDLWTAIGEAVKGAGKTTPVESMMNGWVFQAGYPIVSVEPSQLPGHICLKQRKFTYLPNDSTSIWHTPVNIRTRTKSGWQTQTVALFEEQQNVYVGEPAEMIVANAGGAGFFRVKYGQDLRAKLLENLAELETSERFNLAGDLWSAVLSGELPLRDYLQAAATLCTRYGESDHNVWTVVLASLMYMRRTLGKVDAEVLDRLVNLARGWIMPKLNKLGFAPQAGETAQTDQLRASLFSTLGVLGDKTIRSKAAELFERYLAEPTSVSVNMVPAVIETVAAAGDEAAYERFRLLKTKAATPQEETRYLFALAGFCDEKLTARTLGSTLSGEIRTQDVPGIILKLLQNPAAGHQTFKFIRSNWDGLVKLLPLQGIIRICDGIPALADEASEEEARKFFATHTIKGSEKAVAQNLELLAIANRFGNRERGSLQSILLEAYGSVISAPFEKR